MFQFIHFLLSILVYFTLFFFHTVHAQNCALCQHYYRDVLSKSVNIEISERDSYTIILCTICFEKYHNNHDESDHHAVQHHTVNPLTQHLKKQIKIEKNIAKTLHQLTTQTNIVQHLKRDPNGITCQNLTLQLSSNFFPQTAHTQTFHLTFHHISHNGLNTPFIFAFNVHLISSNDVTEYAWSLLEGHPHQLFIIFLEIRNALDEILLIPQFFYQLMSPDLQKKTQFISNLCTDYIQDWFKYYPSYSQYTKNCTHLTLTLAPNIKRCSTAASIDFMHVQTLLLSETEYPINDLAFYGKTFVAYQKTIPPIEMNSDTPTVCWNIYTETMPILLDEKQTSPTPILQKKLVAVQNLTCCSMNRNGTVHIAIAPAQDTKNQCIEVRQQKDDLWQEKQTLYTLDECETCLAISNEYDDAFYISIQNIIKYQIYVLKITLCNMQVTEQKKFSFFSLNHPKAYWMAHFSSTANLLFIKRIIPNDASPKIHLIFVCERRKDAWYTIVKNVPFYHPPLSVLNTHPYAFQHNANMVSKKGRYFVILSPSTEKAHTIFINIYEKSMDHTWTMHRCFSYNCTNKSIQYINFSDNESYFFIASCKKVPPLDKDPFLSSSGTLLVFHMNHKSNPYARYTFPWIDQTIVGSTNQGYPIQCNHIGETIGRYTIYTHHATLYPPLSIRTNYCHQEKHYNHFSSIMHASPIALSQDEKIIVACDDAIFDVSRQSFNYKTLKLYKNCGNSDWEQQAKIDFSQDNKVIFGVKMWTFDRYIVCWGHDQKNNAPFISVWTIVEKKALLPNNQETAIP